MSGFSAFTPASELPPPVATTSPTMPLTLKVGEQKFLTLPRTLREGSHFFASLLSGRWDNDLQADGSYFIDADPTAFAHVLRYLRHGILPLFYNTTTNNHNHALYLPVLEQARYFQIPRLQAWIENKEYLQAVKTTHEITTFEDERVPYLETTASDVQIERHVAWGTKKVYICPRGIFSHRGNPHGCGRACRSAQGDSELEYEDENVLRVLEVRKKIVWDQKMCVTEGQ